jgi:hypothetical protein
VAVTSKYRPGASYSSGLIVYGQSYFIATQTMKIFEKKRLKPSVIPKLSILINDTYEFGQLLLKGIKIEKIMICVLARQLILLAPDLYIKTLPEYIKNEQTMSTVSALSVAN